MLFCYPRLYTSLVSSESDLTSIVSTIDAKGSELYLAVGRVGYGVGLFDERLVRIPIRQLGYLYRLLIQSLIAPIPHLT
jgi:hypothetical protein